MVKIEWSKPKNRNLWQQLSKTEYLHLSFRNLQQAEWVIPCCRNAFGVCSYWHPCTTCLGKCCAMGFSICTDFCERKMSASIWCLSLQLQKPCLHKLWPGLWRQDAHTQRGLCDSCCREAGTCILTFPSSRVILWWMNSRFHACEMRPILYQLLNGAPGTLLPQLQP